MKFVFIAKHQAIWPVASLCDALGVSLPALLRLGTRERSTGVPVQAWCHQGRWRPRAPLLVERVDLSASAQDRQDEGVSGSSRHRRGANDRIEGRE